MAGHKTYCRFENNRVARTIAGFGGRREHREDYLEPKHDGKRFQAFLLKEEARLAAEKYTQDKPVNTMGAYWPK
jgi:hypothetical protein